MEPKVDRMPDLLSKLNSAYDKKKELENEFTSLRKEYKQINEDIEMLQMMIMYLRNKQVRMN